MLIKREKAIAAVEAEMDKCNQYVAAGLGGEVGIEKNTARYQTARSILAALRALPVSDGVTDEMVERAARAMCWQDTEIGSDCEKACLASSKCLGDAVAHYRREARTALEAALGPLPALPSE